MHHATMTGKHNPETIAKEQWMQEALAALQAGKYKTLYAAAQNIVPSMEGTEIAYRKPQRVSSTDASRTRASMIDYSTYNKPLSSTTFNGSGNGGRNQKQMCSWHQRWNNFPCQIWTSWHWMSPLFYYPSSTTSNYCRSFYWSFTYQRHNSCSITKMVQRISRSHVIHVYGILPENIYNMDESGFSIRMIQASHVIINASLHSHYQTNPRRQE